LAIGYLPKNASTNCGDPLTIQGNKVIDIAKAIKKGKVVITMINLERVVSQWIERSLLDRLNADLK
jgi:hypothetical protein